MLMTMEPEIQRNLEPLHAHEMLRELKTLFAQQAEQELLQTTRDFHSCRQEEWQSVSSYVLKMKGYIDILERLEHPVTLGLGVSMILICLRKEYDGFVPNYNMHSMGKTVNELHAMLKLHEQTLPKSNAPALNAIRAGKVQKGSGAGGSGIFGLRASRKLKPGALSLYVGNGQCEAVEAIDAFYLCLPSGLEIVLNNCHYAPSIARGVISVFRLYEDSFVNRFVDNTIQVSRNNVVYFIDIPRDGIFEINLSNSLTNESYIYAVSNKRAKLDLDSALLWHCRLGHISKKCIEKLQHDGLLDSADLKAFEKCVSCMSGKLARKPYAHQVKRAKDLLGLIHTDVCGLFKIMSRQGASYFITFTDDFSRYDYVYLLKHKHEVFETFKVFQKEVENQLGKSIKSLCSDCGGEYMSQEFLDHLKDHGIIAHCTPPYTPQHISVSERRNRTLLDMALVKQDTLTKPDKLEPRSIKCIFVGYPKKMMGYSFYYPPENKVLVARNARFLENSLINQEASGSLEDLKIIQEEDTHPFIDTSLNHKDDDLEIDEPQSDIVPIRRSTRTRHAPDCMCLYIDAEEHELRDLGEPTNYKAALLDPESEKWLNAMNVEMKSMKDNEVWVLVELPPNRKPLVASGSSRKKPTWMKIVKTYLGRCFAMKDLGEAAYILGIKIYRDRSRRLIGLCQSAYIEKILKRYCMKNSKRESISMQEKLKLSKSQGASTHAELKRMQNVSYASAVGSIMYVVRCTRSDVAFAQNVTSQFQQNPGDIHWTTVNNILKYLRNTKDIFLVYGESEYIAAFDASKEAVWVRKFISGLGVVPITEEPISMYCDNTRAITIPNESRITKGARHFYVKVHYLREVIEYGDIKLEKVHTDDKLADPFTKALAFLKHSEHTRNIGKLPASSLM
uniref:Integrase catalytic domain-containing protein n=1 Tax=Tanacetum cinerariifolium TaxID=118510 RepID=A0A699HI82_TANCI|nr:hypothetical protein [Tanacetum cinerariifolium]